MVQTLMEQMAEKDARLASQATQIESQAEKIRSLLSTKTLGGARSVAATPTTVDDSPGLGKVQ